MKAVLAHGGGPTAVINASLAGVVEEARRARAISGLYCAVNGLEGVLSETFIDLFAQSAEALDAIAATPSSAAGSSRKRLDDGAIDRVLRVFQSHDVRVFFYTGGNGSMGTAARIAAAARASGSQLQVIGIPKTIDNDLAETDHSPGYATTARFFACALRDIGADNRALPGQVEFVEVLGRNAGWLVAATSFARHEADDPPHLIYLPESPLPLEKLLDDVERVYRRLGRCVVAVCEGQLDESGEPFGADAREGSGGKLAMNLAHRLARLVTERLKIRARSEKPGLLGRTGGGVESPVDRPEARLCGRAAARAAAEGVSGSMVTLVREPGGVYRVAAGLAPLERVARVERLFPAEWRSPSGNDVTEAFAAYARPLIGELARYPRLEPVFIPRATI